MAGCLALCLLLTSGGGNAAPASPAGEERTGKDRLYDVDTLEEFLTLATESIAADLPKRIGTDTTLVAVRAEGRSIHYVYELDASGPDMNDPGLQRDIRSRLAMIHCHAPWMRRLLELGGSMRYEYHRARSPVVHLELDHGDCDDWLRKDRDLSA